MTQHRATTTARLRRARHIALALTSLLAVTGVGFAVPSDAAVTREQLSNAEPTNLVNISPIRIDRDVSPGDHLVEPVTIFNDDPDPASIKINVIDLGPPKDETLLTEPIFEGSAEFGAKDWITPDVTSLDLKPFEKVKFDVVIEPPADAPVGSSYAGLQFVIADTQAKVDKSAVGIKISSVMQILLTVPGAVTQKLTLLDAQTRDAFHVGSTSFVTYGARYKNDGTVSDHVKGKVVVTSIFGNKAEELPIKERTLIRGATGSSRLVWSDPPAFGIFTSKLELQGDDGKVITKDLGRVILLPPWWLIALIVALIVIPPVYLWWRRRREWMLYMEDEEWDADGDEHAAY
jgi:hypothetical protein